MERLTRIDEYDYTLLKEAGITLEEAKYKKGEVGLGGLGLFRAYYRGEEVGIVGVMEEELYSFYRIDKERDKSVEYTGNLEINKLIGHIKTYV